MKLLVVARIIHRAWAMNVLNISALIMDTDASTSQEKSNEGKKTRKTKSGKTLGMKRSEFVGKPKTYNRARFSVDLNDEFFGGTLANQTLPLG